MTKGDFNPGTSNEDTFFYWMNERHSIWKARYRGWSKPWTDDAILQNYKFMNVYRQLDKTTIALHENILNHHDRHLGRIIYNVVWFRMFGAYDLTKAGYCTSYNEVEDAICSRVAKGEKVFTGAYMSAGNGLRKGEPKHMTYLGVLKELYNHIDEAAAYMSVHNTLQSAYEWLLSVPYIGPFYAYEMACDLRFTPVLSMATDKCHWANIGPGAVRGLQRLGLPVNLQSLVALFNKACAGRFKHIYDPYHNWPFELREIEHSLCEFDKYERIRLEQGKVKGRYNGTVRDTSEQV